MNPTLLLVPVFSYIDPTGGLPPSMWGVVLAGIAAAFGATLTAMKLFGLTALNFVSMQLKFWPVWVGAVVVLAAIATVWWSRRGDDAVNFGESASSNSQPRVLVLGFDGLDPNLLEEYMDAGRLPNFSRLARDGVYHRLPTSNPPQSPVAWCSFITCADPGSHGVYDFIRRDPSNYMPDLSIADRQKLTLPWRGTAFWEQPELAKLGTIAQRLPMVFPPPKMNGRMLAGMGVWDVRGTEGTYFFYSTKPADNPDTRGMLFQFERDGSMLRSVLPGPYRAGGADDLREPFELQLNDAAATLVIQGREYPLRSGRWSDWVEIEFRIGPLGLQKVPAITRVLLVADDEQLQAGDVTLYVSPLNFDPRAPLYPISHPAKYAADLTDAIGLYATRGMPFDTQAVNDGVLSDEHFLKQVGQITDESEKMLFAELPRFKSGLLFAYFEGSDIVQHMFWRGIDPEHPLHTTVETQQHRDAIPEYYEQLDAVLGRASAAMGADGAIVVMSDHGFAPFRRAVHLNAVLRDLGFLALKDNKSTSGELFADIDWSRTRAYALGFNAVYLNRQGREAQGIVAADKAASLAAEISQSLERWIDPVTQERPMKSVHLAGEIYGKTNNDERSSSPDLIVGYRRGYRASWKTALGAVPAKTVEANRKKWSGDHCIDASEVPGIFLSNDKTLDAKSLQDVGLQVNAYLKPKLESAASNQ